MPTITFVRHSEGIDRTTAQLALPPGKYRTLKNLIGRDDRLQVRSGRTRYLTQIDASKPVTGLARLLISGAAGQQASTAGPRIPGTFADDAAVGTVAWSNPANAGPQDGVYAVADGLDQFLHLSHYLKATNLGFAVPSGTTLKGIKVDMILKSSVQLGSPPGYVRDYQVRIVKGGVIGAAERALTTNWPTSDTLRTWGSETDLWGEAWTFTDWNASGFGVAIAVTLQGSFEGPVDDRTVYPAIAHIDHIRITVYYDTATGGTTSNQVLLFVGASLYSDKTGAWAAINGANPLTEGNRLALLPWKGYVFIQDHGANGPYKYDGTTFSAWDTTGSGSGSPTAPPKGRLMLLEDDRIHIANLPGDESAMRICTRDDPFDFPTVTVPSGQGGVLWYFGKGDGDYIAALAKLGTMKCILKTNSFYILQGDDAETWDSKKLFDVGAVNQEVVRLCRDELIWTDGRQVFSYGGGRFDETFGKDVEELVRSTPLAEWATRCAVYANDQYWLWYGPTSAVMFDFTTRRWYGPFENLPTRHVVVDRDTKLMLMGSSVAGELWREDPNGDDGGLAIPWEAETGGLVYGAPDWIKRARRLHMKADGGVGLVTARVSNEKGQAKQTTLVFPTTVGEYPPASALSAVGMGAFSAANCVDANLTTVAWNTDAAVAGATVQIDYGASIIKAVTRWGLYLPAAGYAGQYAVEYSDLGASWTTALATFAPSAVGWNWALWPSAGAHRYWRLRLLNTPGAGPDIMELAIHLQAHFGVHTLAFGFTLDGAYLMMRLSGSGRGGNIYQFGLQATRLRQIVRQV